MSDAKICDDCGEPCFPESAAANKARRSRCRVCRAMLCSYCYAMHKESQYGNPSECVLRMDYRNQRKDGEQ